MEKVCPRCNLPQQGVQECEYCGLKFTKYSHRIKWDSFQKKVNIEPSPSLEEQKKAEYLIYIILGLVLVTIYSLYSAFSPSSKDSAHSTSVAIGQAATINVKCFGSPSKESLDRGFEVVQSHDNKAIMEMMSTGELVDIPAGTTATVIDRTLTKSQIRIHGSSTYLWTYSDWLD